MKLFLDTNVLIDIIDADRPERQSALTFLEIADYNGIQLFTTGICVATTAYVIGNAPAFRRSMKRLSEIIHIAPVTDEITALATESGHPDYEDSLLIACAHTSGCDAIITRDASHFNPQYTSLPVFSPREFNDVITG